MPTVDEKRRTFRGLHESGCFVMPNPWDVGTTRWLQHAGFPALATTSAGAAFAMGCPDSDRAVGRDAMLAHVATIAGAADVPVNADFGSGYAADPDGVAESVRRCVETGVAGLSIEDSTRDPDAPLRDVASAAARVRAARQAIDRHGAEVVLTARAECFVAGRRDLDDAIRRLRAYADAGADCLYAPGIRGREQIAAVVAAVAPRPVNVLLNAPSDLTVADLTALGVRRVSVGSGLARVAWHAFMHAARELAAGRFDGFADATSGAELNGFFTDDRRRRPS